MIYSLCNPFKKAVSFTLENYQSFVISTIGIPSEEQSERSKEYIDASMYVRFLTPIFIGCEMTKEENENNE